MHATKDTFCPPPLKLMYFFQNQELLAELSLGPMHSEVPSLAVTLALEAKASHRELTSRLLVDLCRTVLSLSDMESSFDKLLQDLPDLVLDTPEAPQVSFPEVQFDMCACTFLWNDLFCCVLCNIAFNPNIK